MKKDKLFDLLQNFIYYGQLGPEGQEIEKQLAEAGVNIDKLGEALDWFLDKIAEKYGGNSE